ncbi:MAG: aminodeoxychorismate synthase component I [Acidobacteria bacterium]|nr:aminodeoxychorismate synthase component I [Acidobacteriota bacterium]
MPSGNLAEVLCGPSTAHPIVLEGRWLGLTDGLALAALNPVSVLEGGAGALAELSRWVAWHADRFPCGAAVGYLSYELARFFEKLPLTPKDCLPGLSFAYYPRVDVVASSKLHTQDENFQAQPDTRSHFDAAGYAETVEKIRDYIAAGDIYQANLTRQFSVRLVDSRPERIYNRLPRPGASFRAFLRSPGRAIISNSPERFFRVTGDRILASPIKGTIARPADPNLDADRKQALLSSAKDRAENVMIVDLLRNDLGRICRYETIATRMFEVEPLPHLFHLVSHIEGTLRSGTGLLEILRALFPCGSVTGAPKIRAMEILAEVEKLPRGVSMGALGVIRGSPGSARCEMDFNVAIRTMTIEEGTATFNVGGGIVYDSQAKSEYEEMMLKARPLLEALGTPVTTAPPALEAFALGR